jgi:hypothetical protein
VNVCDSAQASASNIRACSLAFSVHLNAPAMLAWLLLRLLNQYKTVTLNTAAIVTPGGRSRHMTIAPLQLTCLGLDELRVS